MTVFNKAWKVVKFTGNYVCDPKHGCGADFTEEEADAMFQLGRVFNLPTVCVHCGAKATIMEGAL